MLKTNKKVGVKKRMSLEASRQAYGVIVKDSFVGSPWIELGKLGEGCHE